MLRPAKLLVDGREFLCVFRDLSNGGLQLQLFHDLPEYDQLEVEFDSGQRYPIRKVWKSAGRMGCAFLEHVAAGIRFDRTLHPAVVDHLARKYGKAQSQSAVRHEANNPPRPYRMPV